MRVFKDYEGRLVTLSDSAERHIAVEHPDISVFGINYAIGETLESPEIVIYSGRAYHYFRMFPNTIYHDKYVKVVIETENGGRYVRTAYPTRRLVRGLVIWEREK